MLRFTRLGGREEFKVLTSLDNKEIFHFTYHVYCFITMTGSGQSTKTGINNNGIGIYISEGSKQYFDIINTKLQTFYIK